METLTPAEASLVDRAAKVEQLVVSVSLEGVMRGLGLLRGGTGGYDGSGFQGAGTGGVDGGRGGNTLVTDCSAGHAGGYAPVGSVPTVTMECGAVADGSSTSRQGLGLGQGLAQGQGLVQGKGRVNPVPGSYDANTQVVVWDCSALLPTVASGSGGGSGYEVSSRGGVSSDGVGHLES